MVTPVTQVAKGIFRIGPLETGHPSEATSPYLVLGNDRVMLCETGEDGQIPGIMDALAMCQIPVEKVAYTWTSHIHMHHIQSMPYLLKKLPNAKFLVHPRGVPHLIEPTRLIENTIEIFGDKCYGPFESIPKERIIAVEDNQVIDLGGRQLDIIYAPGHAPHHMGLFDRQTRFLFAGDMGHLPGPMKLRARHDIRPPLFDLEKFVASARRFMALNPVAYVVFGPGGVNLEPMKTLQWEIDDMFAIEKICQEGMAKKQTFAEIARRVDEWELSVFKEPRPAGGGSGRQGGGQRMLVGMLAFVKRQHPELEMPADARVRG